MWSAPAKHSTRQISEVLERIAYLTELGVDRSLGEMNNVLVRRYARRLAARSPPVSARPAATAERALPRARASGAAPARAADVGDGSLHGRRCCYSAWRPAVVA
jgi:hypothetical protein